MSVSLSLVVVVRVLDLALTLTRINQKGLSELYKSGVFEMLLWKLLAGDIWEEDRVRIAKFLWRTHLVQVRAKRMLFACSMAALVLYNGSSLYDLHARVHLGRGQGQHRS